MGSDATSGWQQRVLYDLADYINGRATKPAELVEDGVAVIKIAELNRGITGATNRVRAEEVQEKHWVQDGDLLFAWSGSVGIHIYRGERAALNQHVFRVVAKPGVDQHFLRYLLEGQIAVFARMVADKQTTMGHVTVADLRATMVAVPPLAEQRRIADVLGSLDDKIESNRRVALVLEETFMTRWSRCIAESVDAQPGHLADIVMNCRDAAESTLPYIGLDEMPRGCTVLTEWLAEGAPATAHRFVAGDILFGKLRPYFRKVGVAPIDGRCSQEILVLRPRDERFFGLALGHVFSPRFIAHCNAVSTGTRMPRAEWKNAGAYAIQVPPDRVLMDLTALARSCYRMVGSLTHESHRLRTIRDVLLPKLVSGKIRVPLAEEIAKAGDEASVKEARAA